MLSVQDSRERRRTSSVSGQHRRAVEKSMTPFRAGTRYTRATLSLRNGTRGKQTAAEPGKAVATTMMA
jgi:hypothetical protein